MAKFLTHPALQAPGIAHGFFTRNGGVSRGIYNSLNIGIGSKDAESHVIDNRRLVAESLGFAGEQLHTPYQTHSTIALKLETPWGDARPEGDAIVARTPGLLIGISTADCGPILFCDTAAGVVAACHAGWKGAFHGIVEETVKAMESFGAQRHAITAVLGPCIHAPSYEVGAEFYARFIEKDPLYASHFSAGREGHYQFNLPGFIQQQLRAANLATIQVMPHDTCKEEDMFFSYRRTTLRGEPDYGRQISCIGLL